MQNYPVGKELKVKLITFIFFFQYKQIIHSLTLQSEFSNNMLTIFNNLLIEEID